MPEQVTDTSSPLCTQGWTGHTTPGEPTTLPKDGHVLDIMDQRTQAPDSHSSPDILLDLLQTLGLGDCAIWTLGEDAQREALLSHCPVRLEETKNCATVTGPIRAMMFPKCCAVCHGPLDLSLRTPFSIGEFGNRGGVISMSVPLCKAHNKKGKEAWDVRAVDRRSGMPTLRIPHLENARLFPGVDARSSAHPGPHPADSEAGFV